jgi:uncharacterized protein (DUF427 family)
MVRGRYIADTSQPLLVWEKPYYPTYYVPVADVIEGTLVETGETSRSPSRGDALIFDVRAGDDVRKGAAYRHSESPIAEIRDAVAFVWQSMDHWFEEDEEVFVHPRDPYKRVDVLRSSRSVRIEVDGVTVAESDSPTMLFETGLPARTYLPMTDVRMQLLTPTDTSTDCPYKGTAGYWSVGDNADIVWSYPFPTQESAKVAGLVCFYDEKVDVYVDGELQDKPKTVFS